MKTNIINTKSILPNSFRFDPSFHLSEAIILGKDLDNVPYEKISIKDTNSKVFLGNIFSRIFVKDKEHGIPYLAASDTVLADINTGRFLSKKQSKELAYLMLKKDWIVITCSGTIGNVTYTNSTFENHIATHDLIRIVPNDEKILKGYLYAFLSSKYGYNQLTQSRFGGVVKHINADHVNGITLPLFPEPFQKEVDDLIQESARLREEATEALEEAHTLIEDKFGVSAKKKSSCVSISSIRSSHNKRFEAFYHTSENRNIYDYIIQNFKYKTLGDLTSKIFRPGIFKREYVADGVTFLGGADILMQIPDSEKKLSYRQVEKMPELKVKRNWILVTCGGTIGNTVIIDGQLEKCVISQHVMRIVPKDEVLKGYLYAVLSSKIGHSLITMHSTGSVIPQIESHHLELVPVPIRCNEEMLSIDGLISTYVAKIEISKAKEIKAKFLFEQEIEKWNKN